MKAIRVFKGGLYPAFENEDAVREQMRLAVEYRRVLIHTERCYRQLRLAVMEWSPAFCETRKSALDAREAVVEAGKAAKAERARTRRLELSEAVQARLDEARATDRAATGAFMVEYLRVQREHPSLFAQLKIGMLKEQATLRLEHGQKGAGLYWSTYNLVRDAVSQAVKKTPEFGRLVNGVLIPGPDFHSPRDADDDAPVSIGVQLQHGLAAKEAFGSDTQVQILSFSRSLGTFGSGTESRSERIAAHRQRNAARRQSARSGKPWMETLRDGTSVECKPSKHDKSAHREGARKWQLRLRVGSSGPGNRVPIWASWPMVLHRSLPDDAVIQSVVVTRRFVGPHEVWSYQVTVLTAEVKAGATCGIGVVGIDIGWRKIGQELRVCALWGEDGEAGMELRLSEDIIAALRKCEALRAERDRKRDAFLPKFAVALAGVATPKWLQTRTETLQKWESCNSIHNLLAEWKEQGRFAGDKRAFTMLAGYCYRDYHLWEWEDCQRKKALRRRREGYRSLGAALAGTFHTVVFEQFDLRKMATRKPVGEDVAENETARSNRVVACTSELRDCVVQAFVARGGKAVAMPAFNTTRECHITHLVEVFDAAASIRHTTAAGTSWDQDDNAARNLVQRYCERPGDGKIMGGARKDKKTGEVVEMGGGKYRRAKAAKAKRALDGATSREAVDNAAE